MELSVCSANIFVRFLDSSHPVRPSVFSAEQANTGEANYYNLKDKNGNIVEKVFIPDDDNNIFSFHSSELSAAQANILPFLTISSLA